MTQPPVTLAEFRDHLNLDSGEDLEQDEERWRKVVAATELVESKVGPIRPVTLTDSQRPVGNGLLDITTPILEITEIIDADDQAIDLDTVDLDPDTGLIQAITGCLTSRRYTVTWVAGYDPIPQPLMEAVLVVAAQMWESQRGPGEANSRGGEGYSVPRGFVWPNRALQLCEPYWLPAVA